jgi:hypothetical protein
VLRAHIAQTTDLAPGWLRLLTDERLRPALEFMHAETGNPGALRNWRAPRRCRGHRLRSGSAPAPVCHR